ncbi:polysaccharide pyruvyl transferase family protein [Pseudomonadota bacterium]
MNILFVGGYTINSAGDDAPLEVMISMLRERLGDISFEAKVLCRHPNEDFNQAFGVETLQNLEFPTKEESIGKWLRGFNVGDSPEILMKTMSHFEWADLVVLGAGNFINENSFGVLRGMLPRFCLSALFAKITNTPCMLYGLSATVLRSPLAIKMAQVLFESVANVTFRESLSVELLRGNGVNIPANTEILPDPVIASSCASIERVSTIMSHEGIPLNTGRPRLAVSLREFYHRSTAFHDTYFKNVQEVVNAWGANGGEVLFVPQCTYEFASPYADDRYLAETLVPLLKYPNHAYTVKAHYWPWEIEGLYSSCDLALCTRLHAGVFACKQSVPTVALAYEPKVQGFWKQLGLEEFCLPLESQANEILTKLEQASHDYPVTRVAEQVSFLKEKVGRYAEIATTLLGV